ncbi:putative Serine/threonine-protein kinase Nek2 [Paratrimastix pyriformis]|uniref:non-specific serine/threonine protein kinase n=1 Tax=Paratrimastix pyriformis TaxID=342808 RepID=A0ABQ8ULP0_9EUKA|nr:putative Serine/threonine-protein kinase Nek2 [Paratrimastix pyriformis]
MRRKADGKVFACKQINYGRMSDKEKCLLVNEVNILRELRHPNIVRYYDRIIDKSNAKIYIFMEFCDGGDLGAIIKKCIDEHTQIDEEIIWRILSQMLLALAECHRHRPNAILHRDIKPRNIFLNQQKIAKLGDFGLARILHDNSMAFTFCGSPYYMSPEQTSDAPYNEKTDIWSLGCVIYELAALRPPFQATTQQALARKIRDDAAPPLPPRYSRELYEVICHMLEKNPVTRPAVERLLQHHAIALRVREQKIAHHYAHIQHKEEELRQRELLLAQRAEELDRREAALALRERAAALTQGSSDPAVVATGGVATPPPAPSAGPQSTSSSATSTSPVTLTTTASFQANTLMLPPTGPPSRAASLSPTPFMPTSPPLTSSPQPDDLAEGALVTVQFGHPGAAPVPLAGPAVGLRFQHTTHPNLPCHPVSHSNTSGQPISQGQAMHRNFPPNSTKMNPLSELPPEIAAAAAAGAPKGGDQEAQQRQQQMAERKKAILHNILTPEARERLSRIALVKPEDAAQIENSLVAAAPRLSEKVDETRLISFLEQAGGRKHETKITFKRRGMDFDDDDDM